MAVINGTDGNDRLLGEEFEDNTVYGHGGRDLLDGGGENDELFGGADDDAIYGRRGDDLLEGGAGNDRLDGVFGDDILRGGAGNDTLKGSAGADLLNGGQGNDTAIYAGSRGAVEVNLATGTGTGGQAEGDVLRGIENLTGSRRDDTLTGDSGNNHIDGGGGDDTLHGGLGDDTLEGGAGADELAGGAGADTFVFRAGHGLDVVKDFSGGEDMLELRASGVTFSDLIIAGYEDDTLVVWNEGVIRLEGVQGDALTEDSFAFA
ncbi:MAG: calcium-binding protein [Rhodobacteraceae bacterium]|nr:calcium-binding protein [Paracoccaceae bacterium]